MNELKFKVESIKINYYKSFTETNNILDITYPVVGIIGKNESGKSNIIDSISKISFLLPMELNLPINHNYKQKNITFEIYLNTEEKRTIFEIKKSGNYFSGYLSDFINQNKIITESLLKLHGLIKESNAVVSQTKYLDDISKKIIFEFFGHCPFHDALGRSDCRLKEEIKEEAKKEYAKIKNEMLKIYNVLPTFYFYKGLNLKDSYYGDDIKNIKNDNQELKKLLKVGQVDWSLFLSAFTETHSATKEDYQYQIKQLIQENVGKKFKTFYKQDSEIKILVNFLNNNFNIAFQTGTGKSMHLSERSQGLKWYFNLLIDFYANDLENKNVVLLIDEPGVFLHINAQQELLNLFDDLTRDKNQLIYTTHSPFLIREKDGFLNIRAVEKDDSGNSKIHKNVYSQEITGNSKMETLSPLFKALGADLRFDFGPTYNKLNIITEGFSDKLYLSRFIEMFDIYEQPFIIPSVGATSVYNVASILLGWGVDFKVLLDYDREGYNAYKQLLKLGLLLGKDIFFVNLKDPGQKTMKSDEYFEIEDLFNVEDFSILASNFLPQKNKEIKMLCAKEFHTRFKEIKLEEKTIKKFEDLLSAMLKKKN